MCCWLYLRAVRDAWRRGERHAMRGTPFDNNIDVVVFVERHNFVP